MFPGILRQRWLLPSLYFDRRYLYIRINTLWIQQTAVSQFHVCCFCSVATSWLTFWEPMDCSTLGFSVLNSPGVCSHSCPLTVMLSNHLIVCHPLSLLLSIFPIIRVFSNKWALGNRWPSYWSFSISTSDEHSGLISFSIDWFDFLAVQRTLGSPHFLGAFL